MAEALRVISIVGARPNFVKPAAVAEIFDESFYHVVVHTGSTTTTRCPKCSSTCSSSESQTPTLA